MTQQLALFAVGVCAGLVLYHAAFGFTSSFRVLISDRRGAGVRAQMLMLALTCIVFFPLLAGGSAFGQTLRGSVAPAGGSVLAGAFIFGIGMQLGGGCASGTLFTAGGGNTRMLIVLAFFIAGSVIGTAHMPWWSALPAWAPTSIVNLYGPWLALIISLVAFATIALLSVTLEKQRHGRLVDRSIDVARVALARGHRPGRHRLGARGCSAQRPCRRHSLAGRRFPRSGLGRAGRRPLRCRARQSDGRHVDLERRAHWRTAAAGRVLICSGFDQDEQPRAEEALGLSKRAELGEGGWVGLILAISLRDAQSNCVTPHAAVQRFGAER